MVNFTYASYNKGIDIGNTLYQHREKLTNIEGNMSKMVEDMKVAEDDMQELQRGCCSKFCRVLCIKVCGCVFSKDDRMSLGSSSHNSETYAGATEEIMPKKGKFTQRTPNTAGSAEKLIAGNLVEVNHMLKNLKDMALEFSEELDDQNNVIESINAQSTKTTTQLKGIADKQKRLLKKQ
ncbi:hypothetical protein SNEBB_008746 [Seison nebaliae]|nr:hypothetical protein SNEBB_008746 [Seison nebaliae]